MVDLPVNANDSNLFDADDDGRLKRTGNTLTASARIIAAVIGTNVLSSAWALAQLGWIAGPIFIILFAFVNYYTSSLLTYCYRSGDPVTGSRNYTYMHAVHSILGGMRAKVCGWIEYLRLFAMAIGSTNTASMSMMAIKRTNCFHANGHKDPCRFSSTPYMNMIIYGIIEIIISQIPPEFEQTSLFSIVAVVMFLTYSGVGAGLSIGKVAENGKFKGIIGIGSSIEIGKIWSCLQALGGIASACSYTLILIETQDTLKSSSSEAKTMKNAILTSITVITIFNMLCGCMGYAAFGDLTPENLLTGFKFYNPYWLIDIANATIVIHLICAYQVYCQPIFTFIEQLTANKFPDCDFITKEFKVLGLEKLTFFRLVWRSVFVVVTAIISMLLPFLHDVADLLRALGFWLLTVYYPVEMYISRKRIVKWSSKWAFLRIFNVACLIISIAAAAGYIARIVLDLKTYKPFGISY